MEIRYYIVFSLLLSSPVPTRGLGAELKISVKYPDGAPAKGIKVQEVQLERQRIYNRLLGSTDDNGTVEVEFEAKPRKDCKGEVPRGYGVYRYVVMPDNYRWVVSDLYYWNKGASGDKLVRETNVWDYESYERLIARRIKKRRKSNWLIGKLAKVKKSDRISWEVVLNKGSDVTVSVNDQFGEPVRNETLSVSLDLEVLSHTGWGGGIPMFDVQTNGEGCFNLANTGQFFYTCDLRDHRYYAPGFSYWTGIVPKMFDNNEATLVYHRCEERNVTFEVTDKRTAKPVPQAQIFQVKSFRSTRQGGPFGYTDVNGEYISRKFYTEHVVEFGVAKDGYEPWVKDIKEFIPGATYTISLEPQEKPYQPGVCGFKRGGVKGEAED